MMKDNIWAFANALSQVCVEDDSVSFNSASKAAFLMCLVMRASPRESRAI